MNHFVSMVNPMESSDTRKEIKVSLGNSIELGNTGQKKTFEPKETVRFIEEMDSEPCASVAMATDVP